MNDRKDSIKEKIVIIGKINMNQLTEKDLKVQKRTISLLLTRKKKRKKKNFKWFNKNKKYKVLHLTDNKKKQLSKLERDEQRSENDSRRDEKRSYGEINENRLTKKILEVTEKDYH